MYSTKATLALEPECQRQSRFEISAFQQNGQKKTFTSFDTDTIIINIITNNTSNPLSSPIRLAAHFVLVCCVVHPISILIHHRWWWKNRWWWVVDENGFGSCGGGRMRWYCCCLDCHYTDHLVATAAAIRIQHQQQQWWGGWLLLLLLTLVLDWLIVMLGVVWFDCYIIGIEASRPKGGEPGANRVIVWTNDG